MARMTIELREDARVAENMARDILRKFAPRAFVNKALLESALENLRARYESRVLIDGRSFVDFVRCYAENAVSA